MKSKLFLHNPTLFTLTVLLLFSGAICDHEPTKLQGRYEADLDLTPSAPAFFKIENRTSTAEYLSISALSDKNCTPSIAVSYSALYPTKEFSDYYFGEELNKAILFIPTRLPNDTTDTSIISIAFSTDIQCIVTVTVEEAFNFKVSPDIDEYYSVYELGPSDLQEKTSVVLTVDIPDIPDADRILLHLNGINLDQRNKPYLDVFVKKGQVAPDSSNNDQVSMRQWFEGVTVLIYNDSPAFCTNCQITVSMKFEENAFLQIHVGVLHSLLHLRPYSILDGLEKGKQNTYIANFNEGSKDQNLRIVINPILGNFTAYMHCDAQPDNLSDFRWNFTVDSFEQILLTPKEHSACETNTYFLVLTENSGDNAFYSIGAQQRLDSKLFMEKDISYMGDIVPDEPVIYDVFVPIYAAEKITLTLTSRGNIDINIKNCRYASDCPDLLPPSHDIWELLGEVIGTVWPDEFEIETVDTGNGKKVTIDPHKNGCVPFMMRDGYQGTLPLPVCAYKIELKSNETAEYRLIADLEGHTMILPGYPIEGAVLVNDQNYYILYAPYDDLKSVAIQLTTLSGDVELYVSNTTLYPSQQDDTTKFSHDGFVIFTNDTGLNGTYYITVKGHQTSSYILTATLITQDGRSEDYAVRLHEGVPQTGVLLPKHEHPMLFYSINVFFDNDWEGLIKININPNHGNLAMTVMNTGQVPMPNWNLWQSTSHELTINSSDISFRRRAIYHIGIYPDPDDSLSYDEITFTIVYSFVTTGNGEDINQELEYLTPLNSKHIALASDSPFEGRISKGEIRFFKFNAYSSDETVTVSLQSSNNSVALFVSTNASEQYPGPDGHTFTTKDTYRDYITITKEDLEKTCPRLPQEVATCPIFLSVITTAGDELPFVVDIRRGVATDDTSRTPLVQISTGKERLFKVPADQQFIYFYFFTLPDIETLITVTARHHDIEIYGKIAEIPLGQDVNKYFGDIETMSYPETSGQNEMTMTSYNNLKLPSTSSTNPIVVIAKLRFKVHQGEAFDYTSQPTFSIIASNVVTNIFPGKVYNTEAYDDDTFQYYSFYAPDPQQSFKITLTSLSEANQDLYLTYGKFNRPTIARHDFYSASSPRVEELSVEPLDIYPRTEMNGTWTVGVYAETKGQYSLLVTFGNQVVQLTESSPIEQYLPENSSAYFSYYNDHETDLYIKLGKMSGNPIVYIHSLKSGNNVADNLPSNSNYTWMFRPSHQATTGIKTDDPKYCSHCLYVMTVESEKASKFSLAVVEKGHWELAQNDVTYTDTITTQESKGYFFITSNTAGARVNIQALNGKLNVYTSHNPTANNTNYIDKVTVETSDRYKELNMSQDYLNGHPDQATIWDGTRDVASDPWGYYVILENLDTTDVKYTILFRDIGSNQTVITPNIKQHLTVAGGGEQEVLFYSSSKGGIIKVNIEYNLTAKDEKTAEDDKLDFSALYWSEKAITGLGKAVDIRKDDVNVDKIRDGVKLMRKNVEIKSQVGKYEFSIENPTQTDVSFSILVYTAEEVSYVSLEGNSYHFSRLRANQTETFEVYLPGAGSWYLEMNQCSGKLRIAIANSTDDLTNANNLFTPDSDSFLNKFYNKNAGSKYIRVFADEADEEDGASFLLRNFYFKEDALINFDTATAGQLSELSGQYDPHNNTLPVSFEPVSFAGSKKEDFVLYKVVACQDEGLARTIALCDMRPLDEATGENCQFDEFSQDLSKPIKGQTSLELMPGDYHVYIVGNIMHKGGAVHSVVYTPATVTLKGESGVDQVKKYLPYIGIGVAVLLVLVGVIVVCKRYQKKKAAQKQTELENFRRRGYGVMHEEFES